MLSLGFLDRAHHREEAAARAGLPSAPEGDMGEQPRVSSLEQNGDRKQQGAASDSEDSARLCRGRRLPDPSLCRPARQRHRPARTSKRARVSRLHAATRVHGRTRTTRANGPQEKALVSQEFRGISSLLLHRLQTQT